MDKIGQNEMDQVGNEYILSQLSTSQIEHTPSLP